MTDDDRFFFLNCLREACERYGALVHAYCLMGNHYHLFMETPLGGLSKIMHDVNTSYAAYFNKKHEYVGHPFQGRFKAILVQSDTYALELSAYIHLNPVRARIVERPEQYLWSNYREYIGLDPGRSWTSRRLVLSQFGLAFASAEQKYRDYVLHRASSGFADRLKISNAVGILGDPEFISRITTSYIIEARAGIDRELPQMNRLLPQPRLEDIRGCAESTFGEKNRYSRRVAIYLSHKLTGLSLRAIGAYYDIGISGVTDICRRMKREMGSNESLAGNVEEIEKRVRAATSAEPSR
jgi:putative transposase